MTTPKVEGKAIYFELVKNKEDRWGSVKQILVFPKWTDDTGREHPVVMMERQVSELSPRAQWRSTSNVRDLTKPMTPEQIAESESSMGGYIQVPRYTREEWDELPERAKLESQKFSLEQAIKRELIGQDVDYSGEEPVRAVTQVWNVRDNKPIVVETTNKDLEEVHLYDKTPQAVIRRINKVRDTLDNYPKKLVKSI